MSDTYKAIDIGSACDLSFARKAAKKEAPYTDAEAEQHAREVGAKPRP